MLHAQDVLRTLGPMLFAGSLVGCGPSVSGSGNSDADGGSGGDAESVTSTGGPAGSTGEGPFVCERGEELLPGLCFDRYPVELPGPLVGDRATGANLDAEGGDELVVELLLDTEKTLVVFEFDPESGMTLQQEALPTWHLDRESTELLSTDVWNGAGDEVIRTMDDALNICGLDEDGVMYCDFEPAGADELKPAITVNLDANAPAAVTRHYLVAPAPEVVEQDGYGLSIYRLGSGSTGMFNIGALPTSPCSALLAAWPGDVDGDGLVDIVHRSTIDCLDADDPRRDDVMVLKGLPYKDFEEPPPVDTGLEPTLLVVADFDNDGVDDLLVHDSARGSQGYRLLRGTPSGVGAPKAVGGPAGIDRMVPAQVDRDGPKRVVVSAGDGAGLLAPVLDVHDAFDSSLGRLLAVADVNGDGRDDLILSGADEQVLELLVVTD